MVKLRPFQCLEWVVYKLIDRVFDVEFDLSGLGVQVPENFKKVRLINAANYIE